MRLLAVFTIALAAAGHWPRSQARAQDDPGAAEQAFESRSVVETWTAPRAPARRVRTTPALDSTFAQSTNSFPDGDGPSCVAVTPDGRYALVTNHTTGNVGVVDLESLILLDMIATPEFPEYIAVTPNGRYALTADAYNNTVSIIDLQTFSLITSISTGGTYPYRIEISADSKTAIVGCLNDANVSAFTVIDIDSRTALRSFSSVSQGAIGNIFTFETGQLEYVYSQFAITPDAKKVIALDRINSRAVIYNSADGSQAASLNCPSLPTAIRVNPSGTRAAITHESGVNQVSVINIPALTLQSFPTGSVQNQAVAITNDGTQAISIQTPANVVFTNLTNGTNIPVVLPSMPQDLALYANGTRLFASGLDASIIDVASRTVVVSMEQAVGFQAAVAANYPVGVSLNNRYREDIQVYQLDPAGSYPAGVIPTGMAPESDTPRSIAMSPDGHVVVAANNVSGNACVWDLTNPDQLTITDVGLRPLDVAIRPDGQQAVLVAADSDLVSFLDLTPGPSFGQVSVQTIVPTRPVRVLYSNDGATAFVLCIDAKNLVSLDTTTGAIEHITSAGTTRISYAVSYLSMPGMTISPDGNTLALCEGGASPPRVRFYNTSNLTLQGVAPTGSYPLSVAFNPASSIAYVASYATDTVAVIRVSGGPIAKIGTIPTLAGPLTLNLDQAGRYLYVGCFDVSAPGVSVVDTMLMQDILDLELDGYCPRASAFNPACSQLFFATQGDYDDRFFRLHADGPATTIIDRLPLSWSGSDMKLSRQRNVAVVAQPVFDTFDLFMFEAPVDLDADGNIDLADFFLFLNAFDTTLPLADINDDGVVDLEDFFGFLNGFDTGCT